MLLVKTSIDVMLHLHTDGNVTRVITSMKRLLKNLMTAANTCLAEPCKGRHMVSFVGRIAVFSSTNDLLM